MVGQATAGLGRSRMERSAFRLQQSGQNHPKHERVNTIGWWMTIRTAPVLAPLHDRAMKCAADRWPQLMAGSNHGPTARLDLMLPWMMATCCAARDGRDDLPVVMLTRGPRRRSDHGLEQGADDTWQYFLPGTHGRIEAGAACRGTCGRHTLRWRVISFRTNLL